MCRMCRMLSYVGAIDRKIHDNLSQGIDHRFECAFVSFQQSFQAPAELIYLRPERGGKNFPLSLMHRIAEVSRVSRKLSIQLIEFRFGGVIDEQSIQLVQEIVAG